MYVRLAVVAMAGLAAEGLKYDKVIGQSADLFTLQVQNNTFAKVGTVFEYHLTCFGLYFLLRFINRSNPKLSNDKQQNLTRWAVSY